MFCSLESTSQKIFLRLKYKASQKTQPLSQPVKQGIRHTLRTTQNSKSEKAPRAKSGLKPPHSGIKLGQKEAQRLTSNQKL